MPLQFVTDQFANSSVTAAKAKLDEAWQFTVAPQSTVDASSSNDLVRYSQIQGLLNGVHWKESVKVATTGNITLSGTQTIDGIAVSAGQRVLVRAQSSASSNGIYVAAAGSWARSADMDQGSEFVGAAVIVREGSTQSDTGFICTNDVAPTLGSTAIAFTSFFNSAVADGSITDVKIASNAAIAFSKLASLTAGNLLVGSAGNVVTSVALSGDATLAASGALTIANSAITNAKVDANAAIAFSKLEGLDSGRIIVGNGSNVAAGVAMSGDATIAASGALTIANAAITGAKIGDAEVALTKLEALNGGQFIVGNASNRPAKVTMSGDATLSNSGALQIAAGAIDNAKIDASAAIAFSKLEALNSGRVVVGSGSNVATPVVISGDATLAANGALTIANDAITGPKIGDAEVALNKLEGLNSAQLIVGNASNRPAKVAVSGDVTMSNAGVVSIANDTISLAKVAWLPRVQIQAGNGSTAAYDLAQVVESTHYDGVMVFRNGQYLKKSNSPSDLSEYSVDHNSSTNKTRITLGANLPNGQEIVIWYIA